MVRANNIARLQARRRELRIGRIREAATLVAVGRDRDDGALSGGTTPTRLERCDGETSGRGRASRGLDRDRVHGARLVCARRESVGDAERLGSAQE